MSVPPEVTEALRPITFAESPRGISPRGAHRSGLEPLGSSDSCHPLKATALCRDTSPFLFALFAFRLFPVSSARFTSGGGGPVGTCIR